ncbi:hypothetical protein ASU33_06065 [Solirubrum puertoriconensis]|uniref:Uncharacterized protein n=2 Tax=Solirubrum puertoriconensis TaxID=1751427 RepID=A0A9X0HJE9_SOLP1|nr:hypothetical protein ASU33_06065 [Solirubrum puertoriconensis]
MTNEVLVAGELLDLDAETQLLPTYQANDLTKPESIQSDYAPEFSVPFTPRNHRLLGQAAYGTSSLTRAYRYTEAVLRCAGVETMPRALLLVMGAEGGRYQLRLVGGNRRFVDALSEVVTRADGTQGEKTLRDLDFSRFDHNWSAENIAVRLQAGHFASVGWGYLLADRGKPLNLEEVSPYELYPTVSAKLIWRQMLAEAGFTANDWASPLLDALEVPSVAESGLSEAFAKARTGNLGIGPDHEQDKGESVNRPDTELDIPFGLTGQLGHVNSPNGNFDPVAFTYTADVACYVDVDVALPVYFRLSNSRCSAKVYVDCIRANGQVGRVVDGERVETRKDGWIWAQASSTRIFLAAGDQLKAKVQLRGLDAGFPVWGYRAFVYGTPNGYRNYFRVTCTQELAPGGPMRLQDWLPDLKLLDFFKVLVQLGGLSPQVDLYEDRLQLTPTRALLDQVPQARDWTRKRDAPAVHAHLPRSLSFDFGSYGQRNYLKWAEDGAALDNKEPATTAPQGYGDGYLSCPDQTLPPEAVLATLPFAATLPSPRLQGLPLLPLYRENSDGTDYERQSIVPRLLVRAGDTTDVVLLADGVSTPVTAGLAYFASDDPLRPSLDASTYVLPRNWAALQAMLPEARYLKEQYRLSAADVAGFDFTTPIWDGVLGDFFAVTRIVEHDPRRATVVELARLHPAYLLPLPVPGEAPGFEFYGREFSPTEYY